ncbi:sodium channel protein Nach isoform X1 [Halyomorpha halys]|uniref:sodium channel protein Nach isoform X1 n=1 Tax=Halyomorpha halys TaxID=286706 RepID=UPI0034D35D26
MWFIFVSTSTIVTLIIIVSLWEKFQTNPTITGLDTDFHNWDVPFPGISVCPYSPARREVIEEYVKEKWGESLTEEKINYLSNFVNLIANLSYDNMNELEAYKNDKIVPQSDFRALVYKVVDHCEDILFDCYWKGKEFDCCDAFFPAFTEKGFCYSFNSIHAEKIWPGKENTDEAEIKINYIYETDTKWTMEFDGNTTDNPYSIYIHSSDELPGVEMSPQHIWTQTVNKMFFASRTTYTTADARQLTAKQRKCIFEDEVKLKTAEKYSYWACMSDCRMRASMDKCNCVPFFYHQVSGFPYCDLEGLMCLSKIADELRRSLNCPCELGCENTVYEVEKLSNSMDEEPIEIGFVSWPMIRYKREVLFGWVDLLVAFGGIAGLFLGFSLLSGVEIIYYFTMRAACMIYRNSETLIKLEEESQEKILPNIDLGLKISKDETKISPAKVYPMVIPNKKMYANVPFLN